MSSTFLRARQWLEVRFQRLRGPPAEGDLSLLLDIFDVDQYGCLLVDVTWRSCRANHHNAAALDVSKKMCSGGMGSLHALAYDPCRRSGGTVVCHYQ